MPKLIDYLIYDNAKNPYAAKTRKNVKKVNAKWVDGLLVDNKGNVIQRSMPISEAVLNINSFMPVTGDIQAGVMAANDLRKGDYGSAALNSLGLLPFVPAMAGTFVGKNAKTWDAIQADKAIKMAEQGIDERKIWEETGTFKGADGQWRQEISDHESFIKKDAGKQFNDYGSRLQSKFYEHSNLNKAYPEVANSTVIRTSIPDYTGSYSLDDKTIEIGIPRKKVNNEELKSLMIHENQHAIQDMEGWALGGDPNDMREEALSMLRRDVASGAIPSTEEAMSLLPMAQFNAYKRLAGEAEARATQSRLNMTPEQRRKVYPYDSYDVPINSLIIRGNK